MDFELYPSLNMGKDFLEMINRGDHEALRRPDPRVFIVPPFEIKKGVPMPGNKSELEPLLKSGKVILFHNFTCSRCHKIPYYDEWISAPVKKGLNIFGVAKKHAGWEPLYITNHQNPLFNEGLMWEGATENMITVSYAMSFQFFHTNGNFSLSTGWKVQYVFARDSSLTSFLFAGRHIVLSQLWYGDYGQCFCNPQTNGM